MFNVSEAFYHTHFANAFETPDGAAIIVDMIAYPALPFSGSVSMNKFKTIFNKTYRDTDTNLAQLTRYEFFLSGPKAGRASTRRLSPFGRLFEFPKINPRMLSQDYCVVYGIEWNHDDDSHLSLAVSKVDICRNSTTYWYKENWYPMEPAFIERSGATKEDDGYLIFHALNGPAKVNHFVVLDALTMEEISDTNLEKSIPMTWHGQFYQPGGPPPAKVHGPVSSMTII